MINYFNIKSLVVKSATLAMTGLFLASLTGIAQAEEETIGSLRGVHGLGELSEAPKQAKIILPDEGIHPRDIPHQPPLIPHETEKVRISLMNNQCLGCHGKLEFKEIGATEIGKNHYINREGEELGHISTRYYFCTQCHAPQADLPPLIENKFQSIVKDKIKVKESRIKLNEALKKSDEAKKSRQESTENSAPKSAPKKEAEPDK